MMILLALLERFAHLLPQALRIALCGFIAGRLLDALHPATTGPAFRKLARAELRLMRLLVAFTFAWQAPHHSLRDILRQARGGEPAHAPAMLAARLLHHIEACEDFDAFAAALARALRLRIWRLIARAPRRLTTAACRRATAILRRATARRTPPPPRALDLSG